MVVETVRGPFRRSRRRRLLGGICGGLAQRYGWNVTLVRVVWAVFAALPILPGAVVYVVLWLLIPVEDAPAGSRPGAPPPSARRSPGG